MRLRIKTFIIVTIVSLLFFILLIVTSRFIILNGFYKLEEENVQTRMNEVSNMLDNELTRLRSISSDWAWWDDTYDFIQNQNSKFIKSNLFDDAIRNLRVDFMLFVNRDGQIVFAKVLNLNEIGEAILPSDLSEEIISNKTLLIQSDTKKMEAGILMFREAVVLVASSTILPSNYQGPSRGELIVGKYMSSTEIKRISTAMHLPISIMPFNRALMPSDYVNAISFISDQNPVAVIPMNKNKVSGYSIKKDLNHKSAFIFKIVMDRKIYKHGFNTILYFLIFSMIISIILIITFMFFLGRFILTPVISLSENVGSIRGDEENLERVEESGNDELTDLAHSINVMLERIDKDRKTIHSLEGIIPICSHCKNIRDDKGYWQKVEKYVHDRSDAEFSHSICPECAKRYYPDLNIYDESE